MFTPIVERFEKECSIWINAVRQGMWVPKMFDRQFDIFNASKRSILAAGPRKSGKTWGVLHKLMRHAWETDGARVAMFSKTLKNSKDGGTWDDMHKIVIPEWVSSGIVDCNGIPFGYTTVTAEGHPGPKVDGQTRTPFFRIRNKFGGESEFKLFSLDFDDDIEAKIKEQRFSAIYFSELDKFKSRKVLAIALPQLRMPHLRRDQQFWIADTNPSEDGEDSWIYAVWFLERNMAYSDYVGYAKRQGQRPMPEDVFTEFKAGLELIEITPEENVFLDPAEIMELKSTYAYDDDLYARYVEGKWVLGKGAAGRHFSGYFNEKIHVAGDVTSENPEEHITILPDTSSFELITGFDLGETNHAAAIIDKVGHREKAHYRIIDELVTISQEVSIREFTEVFMVMLQKLDKLANRINERGELVEYRTERNWSDRSSIEKYSATADTYPHLEVHAASAGRIFLAGVPKGPGSVRQRVRILKRLLAERRFAVSAHCVATIEMLKKLRKGSSELDYVVPDKHKHIFDAITYALLMEMSDDLEAQADNANLGRRKVEAITTISVPLG
jgi:hypothetical protein